MDDLDARRERLGPQGKGVVTSRHAHPALEDDWWAQVNRHSLGWVCARQGRDLVGFVNVAWDGAVHAFLLDTVVEMPLRRQGVGARLVAVAVAESRAAGCEWLHVDFDNHLSDFYLHACGFTPTAAGLILLSSPHQGPAYPPPDLPTDPDAPATRRVGLLTSLPELPHRGRRQRVLVLTAGIPLPPGMGA